MAASTRKTWRLLAASGVAALTVGLAGGAISSVGAQSPTAPGAEILTLSGESTNVDLDASTMAVLQKNGVTVTPVAPASVSTAGGKTTASFPITEGYVSVYPENERPFIRGTFSHSGGLTFSAGGKSISATDFIVNPGSSTLTATVGGNGVQILDLDGTNVKVTPDGATTRVEGTVAKLSSAAAAALNQTFGVTLFQQGIPLGVVRIAAQGTKGPGGAPSPEIMALGGVSTNVDLDAGTATVLKQNNVSVAPVAPATVSGGTASFPISQGYVSVYPKDQTPFIRGTFSHVGGLTFSAGGKSITATDFIVNPGSSSLTATVGGNAVKLLDLDGTNVKVAQDGSTTRVEGTVAKLSSDAAAALNQTFGVTLFAQGIPLGVVRIGAVAGPPSGTVGNATVASAAQQAGVTTTTTPRSTQMPTGGVATGGGGTAGGDGPFDGMTSAGGVAFIALLVAGGSLWRYRAQLQRGA